jgi:hypothetical protein
MREEGALNLFGGPRHKHGVAGGLTGDGRRLLAGLERASQSGTDGVGDALGRSLIEAEDPDIDAATLRRLVEDGDKLGGQAHQGARAADDESIEARVGADIRHGDGEAGTLGAEELLGPARAVHQHRLDHGRDGLGIGVRELDDPDVARGHRHRPLIALLQELHRLVDLHARSQGQDRAGAGLDRQLQGRAALGQGRVDDAHDRLRE